MAELKQLSVIITHESLDECSRLSSVLDSSGFKVLAKQVISKSEFSEEVRNAPIDIILAYLKFDNPAPKDILQELNRLNRDVPVILLSDQLKGDEIAQGIRTGARDVVAIGSDQHLIAVVNRELKGREERAKHRDTLRRFYASENRYQQLLQYARLPMAIIQESMFLLMNDAFSELFEVDKEDIDITPVVDVLDKDAQGQYKALYKSFIGNPETFRGSTVVTHREVEGKEQATQIEFTAVKYNDEDCLQLMIEPQPVIVEGSAPTDGSEISSRLMTRNKLVQSVESCIGIAHAEKKDSSLMCIMIDGYATMEESIGIGALDSLYDVFIDYVISEFEDVHVGQFETNRLMVLFEETDSRQVLGRAKDLCQKIDQNVFEADEISQQFTATAGIALISDLSTNADTAIKQSIRACEQLRETRDNTDIGNGAHIYEPERTQGSSDVDIHYLLKQAFKHTHLQVLFQPMMNLRGDAGKNYEVLLGIRPEHKDAYPDNFIAVATRNNENDEIDRWVILEAMKTLLKKTDCGGDEILHIHVSRQSLENPKFSAWVIAALKKSRLNPKQINFQLREVDVASHLKSAGQLLEALRKVGCRSVITHFGSSVQPMKILEQLSFDFAKVDGSFTLDAQKGESDALTELLTSLTERSIKTIVPMVESTSILPLLWKSNVSYVQGYYVQPPAAKMDYKF